MATMADLNAAVDTFNTELASARTDILNEVANLKNGPDLQPAVDAVNTATQGLKDLVAQVVPAPPAG